jgi:hypothetical protein
LSNHIKLWWRSCVGEMPCRSAQCSQPKDIAASNSIKPLELLACVEESHERGATDCSDQPLGKTVLPRRARYTSLIGGSAGLISNDRVPDHSTFSVNRYGRFRDSNILILRHAFEAVVRACMDAGLVKGEGFAVDASVMEADASRYRGKAPDEIDWSAPGGKRGQPPSSLLGSMTKIPTPIASLLR